MTDCLFVGMNSQNFSDYLTMVKGLGQDSGAYRDLNLSFIEHEGRAYQSMDLLSQLHARRGSQRRTPFHNADFLWPTITYLGTFLSRRGLTFDHVNAFQYEKDALREKLANDDLLAVAIPTTLYVVPWPIQEIIAFVRQHNQKVRIIVGGPYIANVAKSGDRASVEDQLRAIGADFYVIGSEGETALTALLHTLKEGGDLTKVDNLAYPEGPRFVFTKTVVEQNSLADNMVDYSLFSREAIGQFLSTRTAKSCPFACSFCNFPQQAGEYTFMSVEMVERELNAIRAIGSVNTVTFIDDTFNVPKKRFIELLKMMIRNEYHRDFKWNCTLRSDHCDDEIVALMGKAGCEGVFLGVESGSDRMLKAMNKTATRADYLWAIPRLKEEGILAHANVFIGFPGETLESVDETIDLLQRTRPETFSAQPWYANPLTPVWKKRDLHEIRGSSFKWAHKTMDAATACDLVDRIFLTVDESTFLPQYGFFQWSLFYLQRHGMPLERIKSYLGAFNALVREKIIGVQDERLHASLIANLEASAHPDGGPAPAPEVAAIYSGEARLAAERHCVAAFEGVSIRANGRALEESLAPSSEALHTVQIATPSALRGRLTAEVALAAYALLLWRLDELREVVLLAAVPDPVPLVLRPDPELPFSRWIDVVQEVLGEAARHRIHAFDILSGKSRLLPFHATPPRLRAAFSVSATGDVSPRLAILQSGDVRLEATLHSGSGAPYLCLRGRCDAGALGRIGQLLSAVLEEVTERPHARVGDLAAGGAPEGSSSVVDTYAENTFAF